MKISELPNCPQWLRDADTENADVEWSDYGYVIWHDGVWHDGVWRDGDWLGGVWRGGVWRGGVWLDGVWLGGVWHDGDWHDGDWLGEKISENIWTVFGLHWPVTISPTRMQIGCEIHSFAEWFAFDDARIVTMNRHALKFWRQHKAALMALCETRSGK